MEDVVLYGFGLVGKSMLPYIKSRYRVLFWVDKNQSLWGDEYDGIPICPPDSVKGYDGDIIVSTSDRLFFEISDHLVSIGISADRIYHGRRRTGNYLEEIIPFNINDIAIKKFELETCDLLHSKDEPQEFSVMLFCTWYSTYSDQLIINCKKRFPHIHFSIISNSKKYLSTLEGFVDHIYYFDSYAKLKEILSNISIYTVFQLLWIEDIWVYFRDLIIKKCNKLNLCVGGSDFYRADEAGREYKRKLIDMADLISAETDTTIYDFINVYPEVKDRIRLVNFGIEGLDYISKDSKNDILKEKLGFPKDKTIVVCGYNAGETQQHLKIINSLAHLDERIRDRVYLVFPLTYPDGKTGYIGQISDELNKINVPYKILRNYMSFQEMAEFEMCTDILITVQTTDQLSSTMLENMYCGNVVIAGSWLPYENLREKGVFFVSIDKIEDLSSTLYYVVTNYGVYYRKSNCNKELVYALSSWNSVAEKWNNLWR